MSLCWQNDIRQLSQVGGSAYSLMALIDYTTASINGLSLSNKDEIKLFSV